MLVNQQRGFAAIVSRVAAGLFAVTYIMYETIIGTASGILVRRAANLPTEGQSTVADMINGLWNDPIFGDGG